MLFFGSFFPTSKIPPLLTNKERLDIVLGRVQTEYIFCIATLRVRSKQDDLTNIGKVYISTRKGLAPLTRRGLRAGTSEGLRQSMS